MGNLGATEMLLLLILGLVFAAGFVVGRVTKR